MSRQFGPDPDSDEEEPPEPSGHIRNTSPGALTGLALAGLVLGWLLRQVSINRFGHAPLVGWLPVFALVFVAVIIGAVAWTTYRSLHRRHERMEPHHAVNRLVLAKSCALVGALVAGGYFGYALSYVGVTDAPQDKLTFTQAVLAGIAGVVIVAGSLLLERACRVSRKDK